MSDRRVRPREVAERLNVSRPTAIKLLRGGSIPGAVLIYTDERGRQNWRVDRQTFERWLASLQVLQVCSDGA